jgi:hypothetical protein
MVFTGRSDLLAFADQVVAARGGAQVDQDGARPVLVIEGYGGSGRTSVLREIGQRWSARTMTAEVAALALPNPSNKVPHPLLAAILLGLSLGTRVPGFEKVAFDRVVLAHMPCPRRSATPTRPSRSRRCAAGSTRTAIAAPC